MAVGGWRRVRGQERGSAPPGVGIWGARSSGRGWSTWRCNPGRSEVHPVRWHIRACCHTRARFPWDPRALHTGSPPPIPNWIFFLPDNTCTACHGNRIAWNCSCSQGPWCSHGRVSAGTTGAPPSTALGSTAPQTGRDWDPQGRLLPVCPPQPLSCSPGRVVSRDTAPLAAGQWPKPISSPGFDS